MTDIARKRKSFFKWLLLGLAALIFCEQVLIKYLDYRAKWDDVAFRAYLANPGPRLNTWWVYGCQYKPIALIYRYKICVRSFGSVTDDAGVERPALTLIIVGVTGFLSLVSEEHGDRETWDRTIIWELDDNLNVIDDRRKGIL